jgi:hypothetical protein
MNEQGMSRANQPGVLVFGELSVAYEGDSSEQADQNVVTVRAGYS